MLELACKAIKTRIVMAERPPKEVVDTRIRNRIMEYLQLVSSAAQQEDYQRRVPDVNVPTELICSWEDWMPVEEGAQGFAPPVYSAEEYEAIERYGRMGSRRCCDTKGNAITREVYWNVGVGAAETGYGRRLECFPATRGIRRNVKAFWQRA